MQIKILFRLASFSLGIALLLAALFFNTGGARPALQAQVTPTVDRLAEPTLPASPSQADHGAQVWWLSCLPCHGDRGQGLTEEFRLTYPPEEQYCWESGCHGARPYDQGFTLPMQIPAVIGPGTLQKFPDASVLHAYIAAAMPYWKPGSLSEEDSWSVTAYVLRENDLWPAREDLAASNAGAIPVGPPSAAIPTPTASPAPSSSFPASLLFPLIGGVTLLAVLLFLSRFLRRRGSDD